MLGHVEQAAFPLMDVLELRRVPETGQLVLVAGEEDRLSETTEPVVALGHLESYPIQPHRWSAEPLAGRTLRCSGAGPNTPTGATPTYGRFGRDERRPAALVWRVWELATPGSLPLMRAADGRLTCALLPQSGRQPGQSRAHVPRWVAAPLVVVAATAPVGAPRGGSRVRHVAAGRPRGAPARAPRAGYVRASPAPGYSPLYSARHPVLVDQFVTRSVLEAKEWATASRACSATSGTSAPIATAGRARSSGARASGASAATRRNRQLHRLDLQLDHTRPR